MSNEKQSQTSNEKRKQQTDEQDMNKKMAKSRDQELIQNRRVNRTRTTAGLALALSAPADRLMELEVPE